MHFFEKNQLKTMSNSDEYWRNLKRKTFNEIMTDANLDYLYDKLENPEKYPPSDEFCPTYTPNRNPHQVPNGTWVRLLFKHLHKHFYN